MTNKLWIRRKYSVFSATLAESTFKLKPAYISRFYLDNYSLEEIKSVEMHGFSDASARANASCIYLKFILYDGNTLFKFLCSKTLVNSLEKKFLTILRLELMGCVLLPNLTKSCLESLNLIFLNIDVYYWSDSADCIYWIKNHSKIWKQFVQNWVIKIRDNLPGIEWLHCPRSLNPADIPSRGIDI